jgi:hypothetical protein
VSHSLTAQSTTLHTDSIDKYHLFGFRVAHNDAPSEPAVHEEDGATRRQRESVVCVWSERVRGTIGWRGGRAFIRSNYNSNSVRDD